MRQDHGPSFRRIRYHINIAEAEPQHEAYKPNSEECRNRQHA
jgi:hypothetical protein